MPPFPLVWDVDSKPWQILAASLKDLVLRLYPLVAFLHLYTLITSFPRQDILLLRFAEATGGMPMVCLSAQRTNLKALAARLLKVLKEVDYPMDPEPKSKSTAGEGTVQVTAL